MNWQSAPSSTDSFPYYFLWPQLISCAVPGSILHTQHPVSVCFIIYTPDHIKIYLPSTSLWLLAWPNHLSRGTAGTTCKSPWGLHALSQAGGLWAGGFGPFPSLASWSPVCGTVSLARDPPESSSLRSYRPPSS